MKYVVLEHYPLPPPTSQLDGDRLAKYGLAQK